MQKECVKLMTPTQKDKRLKVIERKIAANQKKKLIEIQRKDKKLQKDIAYVLELLEKNPLHTTYE